MKKKTKSTKEKNECVNQCRAKLEITPVDEVSDILKQHHGVGHKNNNRDVERGSKSTGLDLIHKQPGKNISGSRRSEPCKNHWCFQSPDHLCDGDNHRILTTMLQVNVLCSRSLYIDKRRRVDGCKSKRPSQAAPKPDAEHALCEGGPGLG